MENGVGILRVYAGAMFKMVVSFLYMIDLTYSAKVLSFHGIWNIISVMYSVLSIISVTDLYPMTSYFVSTNL